jgi:hypothetical protein
MVMPWEFKHVINGFVDGILNAGVAAQRELKAIGCLEQFFDHVNVKTGFSVDGHDGTIPLDPQIFLDGCRNPRDGV